MKKLLMGLMALLTMAGTPALAQQTHPQPVPRSAQLHRQQVSAEISSDGFNRLDVLDADCRTQLKRQWPSWFKNVGYTAARNAVPTALSALLAANVTGIIPKGSVVGAGAVAKNTGIVTAGGGIGAGITGYEMGKHFSVANCMDNFTRRAARERSDLRNVVVIYNPFQVNGHPVRGPNGQKLGKGDYFTLVYHPEHPENDAPAPDSRPDSTQPPQDDNASAPPSGN